MLSIRTSHWGRRLTILVVSIPINLFGAAAHASGSLPTTEWRAAYAGEMITHPGAAIGATRVLAISDTWSGFRHSLVLTPEIGAYDHPRNHIGAFFDVTIGWRLSHTAGATFAVAMGAGYLHTWLDGPVYQVDDSGVRRIHDFGRAHLLLTLPLEFGWRLSWARDRWLSPFLRLSPLVRYPYNGTFLPQGILELGIAFPHSLLESPVESSRSR